MRRRAANLISRTSLILSATLFAALFASFVWLAGGHRNGSASSVVCVISCGNVHLVYQGGPELIQRFARYANDPSGPHANTASLGIDLLHLLARPNVRPPSRLFRALDPYFKNMSEPAPPPGSNWKTPPGPPGARIEYALNIPLWLLAAIAALPWGVPKFLHWWRSYPEGHCQSCGYDLCMSPDRCPECGAIPQALETNAL